MPYLKINHDCAKPTFEELELPEKSQDWLLACYDAIDCQSIEIVRTVVSPLVLVVDEQSKLYDNWEYRINQVASLLYGSRQDFIVGDAILARCEGPDLFPLNDSDIQRLKRFFPY